MKLVHEDSYAEYCEEQGCRKTAVHNIEGHHLCAHHYIEYLEEEGMLID